MQIIFITSFDLHINAFTISDLGKWLIIKVLVKKQFLIEYIQKK